MNQSPSIPELNERAREVFRQIVDSYLASGAPVGSRTLSKLGALEYILQPHLYPEEADAPVYR